LGISTPRPRLFMPVFQAYVRIWYSSSEMIIVS
jgi:hypothetical protein